MAMTITRSINSGSTSILNSTSLSEVSCDSIQAMDVDANHNDTTDYPVGAQNTAGTVRHITLLSAADATISFRDSTPSDRFSEVVTAGRVYTWNAGDSLADPFAGTTDIITMRVVSASGTGTFNVKVILGHEVTV